MFVSRLNSFLSNVTTRLYKGDTNEKSAETSIPTTGLLKNLDIVYISFKLNLR